MEAARAPRPLDLSAIDPGVENGFRTAVRVLRELRIEVPTGGRVLDLGCGAGEGVRALLAMGYDAYGCDMKFKDGAHVHELTHAGRILTFPFSPYRLPFPDAHFDAIITFSVMEHVPNYDETIREMRRVLKPGGATLHSFPARWRPIEPHVHVPLAGVFRPAWWLRLWAALGFRAPQQRDMPAAEVARENLAYLTSGTNYLSAAALRRSFGTAFEQVIFAERSALKIASGQGRFIYAVGKVFPPIFWLYRTTFKRVIVSA